MDRPLFIFDLNELIATAYENQKYWDRLGMSDAADEWTKTAGRLIVARQELTNYHFPD